MSMMVLKLGNEVLGKYPIEKGQTLTLGRKQGNDIVVETLIVSGTHAKVEFLEEGFLVTDLRS